MFSLLLLAAEDGSCSKGRWMLEYWRFWRQDEYDGRSMSVSPFPDQQATCLLEAGGKHVSRLQLSTCPPRPTPSQKSLTYPQGPVSVLVRYHCPSIISTGSTGQDNIHIDPQDKKRSHKIR